MDKRKLLSIALIAAGIVWFFWDGIGDIVSPPEIIPPAAVTAGDSVQFKAANVGAAISPASGNITKISLADSAGDEKLAEGPDILALALPGETLTQISRSEKTPDEQITFQQNFSGGTAVTKKISFDKSKPIITLEIAIKNPSEQILKEGYTLVLADAFGNPDKLDKNDGMISVRANRTTGHRRVRDISGEVTWPDVSEIEKPNKPKTSLEWVALGTKYHALILRPEVPIEGARLKFSRTSKTTAGVELHIPPGRVAYNTFYIYAGPKDYDTLAKLPGRQQESINYWYFGRAASLGVKYLRDKLGGVGLGNFGLAIIAVAVALRLVMWPVNRYNVRALGDLKLATAKLAEIDLREPPKDDIVARQAWVAEARPWEDKQRNAAIGAALPMLIFLPVMLVLYYALDASYEFYRQPFLWVSDISKSDPLFILPALAGAAMAYYLWQSRPDIASGRAWYAITAAFIVLFTFFSAGIVLFWLADTALAVAQMRLGRKKSATAPAA